MAGCGVRLWRYGRGRLRPVVGCEGAVPPPVRVDEAGAPRPRAPDRLLAPVEGLDGYWYEIVAPTFDAGQTQATLGPLLASLLDPERDTLQLARELAARYEEIELLYTISETLGRTVRLEEAAQTIVRHVSDVVGAQRASLFVHDEARGVLEPVAAIGRDAADLSAVAVDDPASITARVFREGRLLAYDPEGRADAHPTGDVTRGYRGSAFLSAPILYPDAEGVARPIGVINLTDRAGTDAFSSEERRLVRAVANQVGAAIENARLVARDLARQRIARELELAHDLQLKLLTSPDLLRGAADVGVRCVPAETVGGDFYHLVRLTEGRVGVMLGDVSSRGFSAALIMALVLSAAGIHAEEALSPDGTLRRLLDSVADELAETEMHLSLFYGVIDPAAGRLRYANAGHPHAFRLDAAGRATRLAAGSPPLGLTEREAIVATETTWRRGGDLLVLFSDGLTEAVDGAGETFGEARVLDTLAARRAAPAAQIVDAVFDEVEAFAAARQDDRTLLVLRT